MEAMTYHSEFPSARPEPGFVPDAAADANVGAILRCVDGGGDGKLYLCRSQKTAVRMEAEEGRVKLYDGVVERRSSEAGDEAG